MHFTKLCTNDILCIGSLHYIQVSIDVVTSLILCMCVYDAVPAMYVYRALHTCIRGPCTLHSGTPDIINLIHLQTENILIKTPPSVGAAPTSQQTAVTWHYTYVRTYIRISPTVLCAHFPRTSLGLICFLFSMKIVLTSTQRWLCFFCAVHQLLLNV